MIDKAIYVISEVRYIANKETYFYLVNSGLFGYYEDQLKEEYFTFKEPRYYRKKV